MEDACVNELGSFSSKLVGFCVSGWIPPGWGAGEGDPPDLPSGMCGWGGRLSDQIWCVFGRVDTVK